ncbi:MAG TPA: rhomboid family intramembrane serine protease [Phycisphaerae bacterium]|nr:rhomboid family intramembrane serine protease [Phycisphaerales bacterium]HRX85937.1 rhomboid family intramembrane serine protease [Phycisphaerae bacterium]
MVRVRCQCGKSLKMPPEHVNKRAVCPQCRARVRIVVAEQTAEEGKLKGRFIIQLQGAEQAELVFLGGRGPIDVGKAENAHLRLLSSAVSRRHCRLVQIDRGWRVEDQGSTNGLFVNNRRVKGHNLLHGDVVRIGDFELHYSYEPTKDSHRAWPAADEPLMSDASGADQPVLTEEASALGLHFLDDTGTMDGAALQAKPAKSARAAKAVVAAAAVVPKRSTPVAPPQEEDDLFAFADDDDGGPPISLPVEHPQPAAPKGEGPTCPSCQRVLPPRSKICVHCGIDVKTGRRLLTARDADDDTAIAETTISIISWLFWIGLYPVASEAYGGKKPHAVRVIAVLTILISAWFLISEHRSPEFARTHKNLLLWPRSGEVTAEHIDEMYFYTDWGDARAFHAALRDVEQKHAPADENSDAAAAPTQSHEEDVLEAYATLTPEQKCIGEFHYYQLLTNALLHGGIMHLVGNLLFLFVLGSRVNALIGNLATAILYPLLAIGASIAHMMSVAGEPSVPALGASGAIMGLAGMYFVLFPAHKVHMAAWVRWGLIGGFHLSLRIFAVRGFWVVLFYIGGDALMTYVGAEDGVAHWAHLGGFIVGAAFALILLLGRVVDARGGDLLSVILGRRAWALVGRPGHAAPEEA